MRRAVVVLPLVPVITIDPNFRSPDSFRRTFGSIRRATPPGSVVPPPRRLILDSAAVALPAQTAAHRAALEYAPLGAGVGAIGSVSGPGVLGVVMPMIPQSG